MAVQWGVPTIVIDELEELAQGADAALTAAKNEATRTPVATARCKTAFDALIAKMRDTKKRYFLTPPLVDADYVALGLKPHDTKPTPVPAPTAQVEADITFPGIHLVELKNIRAVAGIAPDSRSDYGVRIYYGFTGPATERRKFRVNEPPKSGNDLPDSVFTRRKKEFFDFDGESGNTVYFCLKYENAKGGKSGEGPFGPMLKAVVP